MVERVESTDEGFQLFESRQLVVEVGEQLKSKSWGKDYALKASTMTIALVPYYVQQQKLPTG